MRWRFTLIDYTFNPAGVSTVIDEPNGWNDMKLNVKRDKIWHGVFFDYSLNNLQFYSEGYSVLKTAYEAKGIYANTDLLVEAACTDTDEFEEAYLANILYSFYSNDKSDLCFIEVKVEEKSCLRTFRTRYDQKVDIEAATTFDGDAADSYAVKENITLPSKPIFFFNSAKENMPNAVIYLPPVVGDATMQGFASLTFDNVTNQDYGGFYVTGTNNGTATESPSLFDFFAANLGTQEYLNEEIQCDQNEITIDVELAGTFTAVEGASPYNRSSISPPSDVFTFEFRLYHTAADGSIKSFTQLGAANLLGDAFENMPISQNFTLSSPGNIFSSVVDGDKFFLIVYFSFVYFEGDRDPWDALMTVDFSSGSFKTKLESNCEETDSDVFLINETLSRTTELITNNCLAVYSDYFGRTDAAPYPSFSDGCGSLECVTSGLHIRNAALIDGSKPKFFISMKDLFDGLNSIHNIGISLEDGFGYSGRDYILRIEPVRFFYEPVVIHTLTNPKNIVRKCNNDSIISKITIGYNKWESQFSGGRDELLSKREYRVEQEKIDNQLSQACGLIASGYAIEVTRRQGQTTEDYKYDNDTFIICLARQFGELVVEVGFGLYVSVNLLSPTILNAEITPVRNLMRWFKTIGMSFSKQYSSSDKLVFVSGDGNFIAQFGTTEPSYTCLLKLVVTENEDISSGDFIDSSNAVPLHDCDTIEIKEHELSWAEYKLIKANPKGMIRIDDNGVITDCFIDNIIYEPNKGSAEFSLFPKFGD